MKKNYIRIMIAIIGVLLAVIIALLIYYNHGKADNNVPKEQPTTTQEPPVGQQGTKPSKPSGNDTATPDINETDSLNIDIQPEEPNADTLAMESGTDTGTPDILPTPEAAFLHIPRTKSIFNTTPESMQSLPSSKVYYDTTRGKIESLVLSGGKNDRVEQLITYDKDGNKLDNLEIGLIDNEGNRIKYAVIYQNKVSTHTLSNDKTDKAQEVVTEYSITNDLRFIKGKTYTKILLTGN